jgi:iron complex transport system ATP-binding protein
VTGGAIRLAGVEVRYRGRIALHDIDLAIDAGERVALIGGNGAGKSTLLRVAAGTLVPTSGDVELLGQPLASLDRMAIARRLGVVPQAAALPFARRVEELVALGRIPHQDPFRGPRPADHAAVDAAIERVGVRDLVGRDARELALPERQLVLIAMAIAQDTPILLLAELDRHAPWLAETCRDLGFRFCDRLHVRLWGDRRGVWPTLISVMKTHATLP